MSHQITVSCVQCEPRIGELEANRAITVDAILAACCEGPSVVVLPELATSGYVFESADEARACGESVDGPSLTAWRQAARECGAVVVGGFAELDGETLYNSAAVVTGEGVKAVYRKLHLWGFEKEFFTPGDARPPVVDTSAGRIGVAICYDLWFPEVGRMLALAGADIMALPTNWPVDRHPPHERPIEVALAMATAHTNRMAVACADRCGTERGLTFLGWSLIVDAFGWPAVPPAGTTPTTITATIDLAVSREKSWGDYNDLVSDRRTDVYAW